MCIWIYIIGRMCIPCLAFLEGSKNHKMIQDQAVLVFLLFLALLTFQRYTVVLAPARLEAPQGIIQNILPEHQIFLWQFPGPERAQTQRIYPDRAPSIINKSTQTKPRHRRNLQTQSSDKARACTHKAKTHKQIMQTEPNAEDTYTTKA